MWIVWPSKITAHPENHAIYNGVFRVCGDGGLLKYEGAMQLWLFAFCTFSAYATP
jgi:hypothetical protein